MRSANLANRAERNSESGHVWEEKLQAAGTIEVEKYSTFRVRAAGAVTVTIDGILAMTMVSGEIAVFNAGGGVPSPLIPDSNGFVGTSDTKETVTITTTGASFVQVARNVDIPRA